MKLTFRNDNYKIMLPIFAVSFFIMSSHGVNAAIGGMLSEFSQYPETTIQLVLSLPPLFIVPFALLSGVLISKVSKKKLLLSGLFLVLVGGIAPICLNNLIVILIARALFGTGLGFINPLAPSLITDYFDERDRSRIMGFQATFIAIGGIFNNLAGSLLSRFGWRPVFCIYFMALPAFLIVLFLLPDEGRVQIDGGKGKLSREIIYIAIITFSYTVVKFVFSNNIAIFISIENLTNDSYSGVVSSIYTFGGVIAGMFFGKLTKSLGKYVLTLGIVISAAGMYIVYISNSIVSVIMGGFLLGCALSIANPRFNMMVNETVQPEAVALGLAICLASNNFAQFASPIIFVALGKLLGNTSMRFQFLMAAIILMVMGIASIIINLRKNKKYNIFC
jgi:MFS family permease